MDYSIKNLKYLLSIVSIAVIVVYFSFSGTLNEFWSSLSKSEEQKYFETREENLEKRRKKNEERKNKNPYENYEKAYNKKIPSTEELNRIEKEVFSMPGEDITDMQPYDTWKSLGPNGMVIDIDKKYCGRVLDLGFEGAPTLLVGSASGGLWKLWGAGSIPAAISDDVSKLIIGAFATNPNDTNNILIGTGEPAVTVGDGMFRTTNGGITWLPVALPLQPNNFYRIKYRPGSNSVVHAATNGGYMRSDNGGISGSWNLLLSGIVTDVSVVSSSPDILYAAVYGDGLYRSNNNGDNFTRINTIPVSAGNWATASVSIAPSDPNYVYVSIANFNGRTTGFFRTTNGGNTWQDISWRNHLNEIVDIHWNQGNYNNCISVSPVNRDVVLLGGGSLLRTSNGGANWFEFSSADVHPDQQIIKWYNSQNVYIGNDGGINYSTDAGLTWYTILNDFPFTQFYGFDAAVFNNTIFMGGGTQDNGVVISTNNGANWNIVTGGDGYDCDIDKSNPSRMFCRFNGSFSKTTNWGVNWSPAGTGLNGSINISNIENDGTPNIAPFLYIGNGNKIFESTDMGSTWTQFTSQTFNTNVWRINAAKYLSSQTVIYSILWNGGNPNYDDMLWVYDNGSWYNRAAGLPLVPLRYVAQHPRNNNKAYALTENFQSNQKVFKTTNRGINWSNITGDLPNIPVMDLVPHPVNDNILFLASDYGMWKTSNGGSNWFRWTAGMPVGNKITELEYIDSVSNGKFYIMAASHGRGAWIRDGANDNFVGFNNNETPAKFSLSQNYPNPFNPATTIKFSLAWAENVNIKVYDITGKVVSELVNSRFKEGSHTVKFDGSNLASGVYFYRITTSRFSDVKKMILVK